MCWLSHTRLKHDTDVTTVNTSGPRVAPDERRHLAPCACSAGPPGPARRTWPGSRDPGKRLRPRPGFITTDQVWWFVPSWAEGWVEGSGPGLYPWASPAQRTGLGLGLGSCPLGEDSGLVYYIARESVGTWTQAHSPGSARQSASGGGLGTRPWEPRQIHWEAHTLRVALHFRPTLLLVLINMKN